MNILIIEDQGPEAYLLAALCEGVNRRVDMVNSLLEAWQKIEAKREYDVVFLDLSLPPLQPEETIQEIPDIKKHSRVIIVTGNPDPKIRTKATEMGADFFLHKNDPEFADKVLAQLKDA